MEINHLASQRILLLNGVEEQSKLTAIDHQKGIWQNLDETLNHYIIS
jgi:hypothetical protein